MANDEHWKIIRQGPKAWNAWKEQNPLIRADLKWADLHEMMLSGPNLGDADLGRANFKMRVSICIVILLSAIVAPVNSSKTAAGQSADNSRTSNINAVV